MRWLINYIRQCFCKHDFDIKECSAIGFSPVYGENLKNKIIRVDMLCPKCGYHKAHSKFN